MAKELKQEFDPCTATCPWSPVTGTWTPSPKLSGDRVQKTVGQVGQDGDRTRTRLQAPDGSFWYETVDSEGRRRDTASFERIGDTYRYEKYTWREDGSESMHMRYEGNMTPQLEQDIQDLAFSVPDTFTQCDNYSSGRLISTASHDRYCWCEYEQDGTPSYAYEQVFSGTSHVMQSAYHIGEPAGNDHERIERGFGLQEISSTTFDGEGVRDYVRRWHFVGEENLSRRTMAGIKEDRREYDSDGSLMRRYYSSKDANGIPIKETYDGEGRKLDTKRIYGSEAEALAHAGRDIGPSLPTMPLHGHAPSRFRMKSGSFSSIGVYTSAEGDPNTYDVVLPNPAARNGSDPVFGVWTVPASAVSSEGVPKGRVRIDVPSALDEHGQVVLRTDRDGTTASYTPGEVETYLYKQLEEQFGHGGQVQEKFPVVEPVKETGDLGE